MLSLSRSFLHLVPDVCQVHQILGRIRLRKRLERILREDQNRKCAVRASVDSLLGGPGETVQFPGLGAELLVTVLFGQQLSGVGIKIRKCLRAFPP